MKTKCERSGDEKLEQKWKWAQVEEAEAGSSSSKRMKKTSEEGSDRMAELAEVL